MSYSTALWLYFLVVFSIVLLPGIDMAFVLANALGGGRRSGLSAVAGIILGGFCHFAMAALGFAVVLRTMPAAFNVMLAAGSLYVMWIGWSLARGGIVFGKLETTRGNGAAAVLRQGMLTNLLNPKAYVFMLAIFPQFVRPAFGPIWLQTVALALICACTQAGVYGSLALATNRVRNWLDSKPARMVLIGRAVGCVLIATAVAAGLQGWRAG